MSVRAYVLVTFLLTLLIVPRVLELLYETAVDRSLRSNFYPGPPGPVPTAGYWQPVQPQGIAARLSFKQTRLFPYTHDSWFWQSIHLLTLLFTTGRLQFIICLNTLLCILTIVGRATECVFFDRLQPLEYQHLYEHILNFVLFKLCFITVVVQPEWEEAVVWFLLYIFYGFISLFSLLCRDRHERLLAAAEYRITDHLRIVLLLLLICILDSMILITCFLTLKDLFIFLSFEPSIILIETLQTLIRYVGNALEITGISESELYSDLLTYIDFGADVLVILVSVSYYFHILMLHGLSFKLIVFVLLLNIRSGVVNLRAKIRRFMRRRASEYSLNYRLQDATADELKDSDAICCVICREPMRSAKKMPCRHLFHR
ncbi:hypothetical protein IWQ60_002845 [Tieghemiomyces parasiticus]|uniref:E3 ubiquitin-protein ligase synoviolin-like TPR repeats domain-containing protein n=1 Tax=Tieghemiomyces parasiticus TaxID=78921 RepID=A0A9W8E0R1_9FUNG|nr:hypothetical protein IWQ60_002845 [Tieghemiomyces parasiticus]